MMKHWMGKNHSDKAMKYLTPVKNKRDETIKRLMPIKIEAKKMLLCLTLSLQCFLATTLYESKRHWVFNLSDPKCI
jgi:hypothetical protein